MKDKLRNRKITDKSIENFFEKVPFIIVGMMLLIGLLLSYRT